MTKEMTTNNSSKYDFFLHWLAMPGKQRKSNNYPLTINQLIEEKICSQKEVNEFYSLSNFPDDIYNATHQWAKTKVPELIKDLYDQYKKTRKTSDLKIMLDFVSSTKEKPQLSQINIFGNINDEQYKQILAREMNILIKES